MNIFTGQAAGVESEMEAPAGALSGSSDGVILPVKTLNPLSDIHVYHDYHSAVLTGGLARDSNTSPPLPRPQRP